MKRRLKRVLVHVPREFLEEFDGETGSLYASRNEAIRAGMLRRDFRPTLRDQEHQRALDELVRSGARGRLP